MLMSGLVWCTICDTELSYASYGKLALRIHICGNKHVIRLKLVSEHQHITAEKSSLMTTTTNMKSVYARVANNEVGIFV